LDINNKRVSIKWAIRFKFFRPYVTHAFGGEPLVWVISFLLFSGLGQKTEEEKW